jgi:GntR family transcriptional repressor for pyruvate dehydrogenase complex
VSFTPVKRSPVYQQVAAQIRDWLGSAILTGELQAGDPLPTEREFSDSFGVSRASIREALRVLQAQGLVNGSGSTTRTTVAEGTGGALGDALGHLLLLQRASLKDFVGLRCVLESAALKAAASPPDERQLDPARRALEEMSSPGISVDAFDAADVRFHLALAAASGNAAIHLVMLALRESIAEHLLDTLRAVPDQPATFQRLTKEHNEILAAVASGHGDRAAALVQQHIQRFYRQAAPATPGRNGRRPA